MATENPRKWPIFFLIVIVIFIMIMGLVVWQWGGEGLLTVIKYGVIMLIFFGILALIIFAMFWLFKKHKKEMVFIMRNSIIRTCKLNKNNYKQELWLKGLDIPFPNPSPLGKIIGFAVIKSAFKKMYDPKTKKLINLEKPKDIIFCTFIQGGFIDKLLGNYEIFAGIYPDDFGDGTKKGANLTSPIVYINDLGFRLSPQVYKMLWCSKWWREKHIIEETAKETIHRFIVEDNLNEIKDVIDKAVSVDPKDKDESSLGEQFGLDKAIKGKTGL